MRPNDNEHISPESPATTASTPTPQSPTSPADAAPQRPQKQSGMRRLVRWALAIVATPFVLFLLAVVLLYLPPVQDFAVRRATAALSDATGLDVSVERLRLRFPLRLEMQQTLIRDSVPADAPIERRDTLLYARSLTLSVRLLPLFTGRADVDALALRDAAVNTKHIIGDTRICGHIGSFDAESHGIEWSRSAVRIDRAALADADLAIALSDTAAKDTTSESAPWDILADRLSLRNTRLRLSLPADSMRLAAVLGSAEIEHVHADTGAPLYTVGSIRIADGALTYASLPPSVGASPRPEGEPGPRGWANAAFAARNNALLWDGFTPIRSFDASFIDVSHLALRADSISYDSVGTLRLAIRSFSADERSGLSVRELSGRVYMDSVRLSLPALRLRTASSALDAQVDLPLAALRQSELSVMRVGLSGHLGAADVKTFGLSYLPKDIVDAWPSLPLALNAQLSGSVDRLVVEKGSFAFPNAASLSASGVVEGALTDAPAASLRFSADVKQSAPLMKFVPADARSAFAVPGGTHADGTLRYRNARLDLDTRLRQGGTLLAKASLDTRSEAYDIRLSAQAFPLGRFLPGMDLGALTGRLAARGKHFDVLSARSQLLADADIKSFSAFGYDLSALRLNAASRGGNVTAQFNAKNPLLTGAGTLSAQLGQTISGRLVADIDAVDLRRLAALSDTIEMGASADVTFSANKAFTAYEASGALSSLRFMTPTRGVAARDIAFAFAASPDTTTAVVSSGDLDLALGAKGGIDRVASQGAQLAELIATQLKNKAIDQEAIRLAVPVLSAHLDAGHDNLLAQYLALQGYSFSRATLHLEANPRVGLDGEFRTGSFTNGNLQLDTIAVALSQDTTGIRLLARVHNFRKQNPNIFEATAEATIRDNALLASTTFVDADGHKGIDLGLKALFDDEGIALSLGPSTPILAYRTFSVNADNVVRLNRNKQIAANLSLVADDGTGVALYGTPTDSVNDLTLALKSFNLGELSNVLPYMPRLTGMLDGDLHIVDNFAEHQLSTAGMLAATDLSYEGAFIGNLGMELLYMPKTDGTHYANAYITNDDAEVGQLEGTYSTATGAFEGSALLSDFPLRLANGFLAGTDVALDGNAAGELSISGTLDAPKIDGSLAFDSAHLYSPVYGFNFALDEQPVSFENSRLSFADFNLRSGKSASPLVVNGVLSLEELANPTLDFSLHARDFELINAPQTQLAMIYGKLFTNFDGTLRGNASHISVRGRLDVLERTDMTYVLKDSPLTVEDRLADLVEFVDFTDSTATSAPETTAPSGFDLTLGINIADAARFCCNLAEDGSNYVNIEGGGNLTFRMTEEGEMRLTGRLTVNSGDMKYSLPIIPLKTFTIAQGSYVDFTGDPMNPTLSISATERVRATVTENDVPRSVTFNVGLTITQTLENMGLAFTAEAPEDLSVQNQLATMTAEQRSKVAVAMLATGMYVTDDMLSTGSGFKASNALNAFLQSEIQNIAGSALRTLDLTIGMENGTSSTGTTTTDYSFQFAKRFWNNRISVIIGGKVSTGADATNSAESFIDNVAVEYRLDQSASRYVKVFYDAGTQDPLEGRLTQTGAGIVLRRKTDRLGDLFIFRRKKN